MPKSRNYLHTNDKQTQKDIKGTIPLVVDAHI